MDANQSSSFTQAVNRLSVHLGFKHPGLRINLEGDQKNVVTFRYNEAIWETYCFAGGKHFTIDYCDRFVFPADIRRVVNDALNELGGIHAGQA